MLFLKSLFIRAARRIPLIGITRAAFCFLLFITTVTPVFGEELNPRGPVSLKDQFTLSIPRLTFSPEISSILEPDSSSLRLAVSLSNTVNRRGNLFLIDSEDRTLLLEFRHAISDKIELGLNIPTLWRGGGVLDSFIFEWHSLFGLPQGPRDDKDISEDEFNVMGATENDGSFQLQNSGVHLGDIAVALKYGLLNSPNVSTKLEVRLPTGASDYGANGIDFLNSFYLQKSWDNFAIHGAAAYSYYSAPKTSGIEYSRFRAYASCHLEFMYDESISLNAGLIYHSNLSQNIIKFPKYLLYLDLGGKFALSESLELELLIRENPAPERGSSDISVLSGLVYYFN